MSNIVYNSNKYFGVIVKDTTRIPKITPSFDTFVIHIKLMLEKGEITQKEYNMLKKLHDNKKTNLAKNILLGIEKDRFINVR